MCILCDNATLDLLTRPRNRLGPGELADAVRAARDAAYPGAMDHIATVLGGAQKPTIDPSLFQDAVVERARAAGVVDDIGAQRWRGRLERKEGFTDARVQAFLSTAAELLDEYLAVNQEHLRLLARYLETGIGNLRYASLGADGELWYEYGSTRFTVLTEAQAMEIAVEHSRRHLFEMTPESLLPYSDLPEHALGVLADVLRKEPDDANEILAGMVDLPSLTEDRVRSFGYAPLVLDEGDLPHEETRFGEYIILRVDSHEHD